MVFPRWVRAENEVKRVFAQVVLKEDRYAEVGLHIAFQRATPCPKRNFSLCYVTLNKWGDELDTKEVP